MSHSLISGNRGSFDLSAENIKQTVTEIFCATAWPAALSSLHRGALPSVVPLHPEQVRKFPAVQGKNLRLHREHRHQA